MKDYQLKCKNDSQCANIIQTKENEIAYDEYDNNLICFYDFFERKIITEINNIHISNIRSFIMIAKDLLLITGREILYIINVNSHNVVRTINVPNSVNMDCNACLLNKNFVLTGDYCGRIRQWRIVKDDLKLFSTKEKAHQRIDILLRLGKGYILSGVDGEIKIWK